MLNVLALRKNIAALGLLASTSLVLPGCSTMGSITSGFGGDPYLSDSSDACYANGRALAKTEDHFARDLVAGALSGAAAGAASGALIAIIGGAMSGEGRCTGKVPVC